MSDPGPEDGATKGGASTDDRRDEERAAIRLRVDYKKLNSFFADYTRNISKGGTFIRTTKPLDVGTQFVFVLTVPSPTKPGEAEVERIELEGIVRWVVPEGEATQQSPAGMGIQFLFDDDAQRVAVEAMVARLMGDALGPRLASKLLGG
jgi:type IV pilus assembly protein PilZ